MCKIKLLFLLSLCVFLPALWAQPLTENRASPVSPNTPDAGALTQLPLRRVVILSSGLTYFQHSGTLNGAANITLPFRLNAMSDALRSLVVNDPASINPVITYQLESTIVEKSQIAITTPSGLWFFDVNHARSIKFTDPEIQQQVDDALFALLESTEAASRQLNLYLPGTTNRAVTLSYVIPSPVWKVSYRLDLSQENPLFQGWAIVDNDSGKDWENVELSLVAGRPVSFIQNLYPPYFVMRPVLPLSIAGAAEAQVHDRGAQVHGREERALFSAPAPVAPAARLRSMVVEEAQADAAWDDFGALRQNVAGGTVETAAGAEAGGQFEFTLRTPVTIGRRTSAMFPLVESAIEGRRVLIYNGRGRFPRLGAEITNNTGMRLPAGPITVFDGGIYAGDALIDFWNEGERRFISFGEDLTVSASMSSTTANIISAVNVSGGVMTITRSILFNTNYTFINSNSAAKGLIVEKNITPNTTLVSPQAYEQTVSMHRFYITLPPNRQTDFTVVEQRPIEERISLVAQRPEALLSFAADHEIPQRVRQSLQYAVELRHTVASAEQAARNIDESRNLLIANQDRVRQNLQAVGIQTAQGQTFLQSLTSLESEINELTQALETARANVIAAQQAFENYLMGLSF